MNATAELANPMILKQVNMFIYSTDIAYRISKLDLWDFVRHKSIQEQQT